MENIFSIFFKKNFFEFSKSFFGTQKLKLEKNMNINIDAENCQESSFDVFEMNWKHYDSKKHEIKTHVTAASAVTIAPHCLQTVILYKSLRIRLDALSKGL